MTFRVRVDATCETQTHVPVVIVGAGACGLMTALCLAHQQIDCVVIERDDTPSGSTSLSSGFIPAAGTQAQKQLGIEDSPSAFAQDIQAKAHHSADPKLVQAYTEGIVPALDFLANQHDFNWHVLTDFLYPGHHQYRMHTLPEKTGQALVYALERACQIAQIPILTSACVTELIVDDQPAHPPRIVGVTLTRPTGEHELIGCDALMLACNGYGGNPDLVQAFIPEMSHATFGGHTGNDGAAVQWAQQLGVALADMATYQGHGSWATPHGILITWALMVQGGVQLNRLGQRFHDESCGYSEASLAVLAQPDAIAWQVYDQTIDQFAQSFPDYQQARQAGAVKRCETLAELAQTIGCAEHAVRDSLATLGKPTPDVWGRLTTRPLVAPYFAIKVTGALFHTQGGIVIDANCRAVSTHGDILPNLWAAGGAARGVSGQHMSGYLSGNGLLSALAGGYLAAQSIGHQLSP